MKKVQSLRLTWHLQLHYRSAQIHSASQVWLSFVNFVDAWYVIRNMVSSRASMLGYGVFYYLETIMKFPMHKDKFNHRVLI
jgi:hypothetical protein